MIILQSAVQKAFRRPPSDHVVSMFDIVGYRTFSIPNDHRLVRGYSFFLHCQTKDILEGAIAHLAVEAQAKRIRSQPHRPHFFRRRHKSMLGLVIAVLVPTLEVSLSCVPCSRPSCCAGSCEEDRHRYTHQMQTGGLSCLIVFSLNSSTSEWWLLNLLRQMVGLQMRSAPLETIHRPRELQAPCLASPFADVGISRFTKPRKWWPECYQPSVVLLKAFDHQAVCLCALANCTMDFPNVVQEAKRHRGSPETGSRTIVFAPSKQFSVNPSIDSPAEIKMACPQR